MTVTGPGDKPSIVLSQVGPFEPFFRQHYARVCNIVFKYVHERSKVEDIAQEIFTELWIKKDSIHIHTSVEAYLRRMAVSRALNYIRDTRKYNWNELDMTSESVQNSVYQDASSVMDIEAE